MSKQVKLICHKTIYYSDLDKKYLSEWIHSISSIVKIEYDRYDTYLYFDSNVISDDDFRELIALFYRYKIDMKQLQIFINDGNREWVCGEPKGYWYRRMLGSTTKSKLT
jgi:hypothetical protein